MTAGYADPAPAIVLRRVYPRHKAGDRDTASLWMEIVEAIEAWQQTESAGHKPIT